MQTARVPDDSISVAELRLKLDAAIRAEAWPAVTIIAERLRAAELASVPGNVVPLRRPGG